MHSSMATSEACVLIDQEINSVKELMEEPLATVELGLFVSLSALQPLLVRLARV